jgi:hypothetical protein
VYEISRAGDPAYFDDIFIRQLLELTLTLTLTLTPAPGAVAFDRYAQHRIRRGVFEFRHS